ncbi:Polynucleotide 5'-hydroxyl-kinase nol9 (Nucleolar protein 9 homolog) [Durusdinium trenchii]|uniref:Polynucleotide 5'-hydroxyl-kinase nol9 (Nucleolar protein 9 homolog) n=1 Tax=Durusdinium trenchii TaxID=1381693 RepID=A0ABP0RUH1_9DINO
MGLTSASSTGEAIFKQAAIKAGDRRIRKPEDRRSKTSDIACLSRAFARAASATGPVADKFQAAGSEPPSELLEVIKGFLQAAVKEAHLRDEFRASPSCLVGVLWAASQCGVPCDTLTQVAKGVLLPPDAGRDSSQLRKLQLPELAELAQALTSLGVEVPELYRAISDVAIQCLQDRSPALGLGPSDQASDVGAAQEAVAGDHVLLPLRIGEEVALSGTLHLRVLRGAAEEFRRIVVPPWSPTPRLLALRGADEDVATSEPAEIRSFLEARKWPVVLCLRAPRAVDAASTAAPRITELQRLREALASPEARHRLRAHRAWPKIVQHFVEQCIRGSSHENPAVLLVMGAKGVGKSTCCRFLVNRLLLQVYFLETDLGQPELGPPGVVTLHRIKDPLLQVPHAEQQLHERCEAFFAGAATPQSHPALYTASVAKAFEAYCEIIKGQVRPPPLMVNSHGWVTGLGLEMLQQIVATVGAQLVLRLQTTSPRAPRGTVRHPHEPDFFFWLAAIDEELLVYLHEMFTLCFLGASAPALARHQRGPDGEPLLTPEKELVLVDIESAVPRDSNCSHSHSPTAVQLRWLRMAAHFKPSLDPCRYAEAMAIQDFFSDVPRWHLPLTRFRFGLFAGHLLPSEVEAALTGAVVALCYDAWEPNSRAVAKAPAELEIFEPHEAPIKFLAYAFIHSFNFKTGELVVYANISAAKLKQVNLLLRGEVTWEPNTTKNLQLGDQRVSPLQPYSAPWLLEGLGVGTRVISTKAKGHLRRRKIRQL